MPGPNIPHLAKAIQDLPLPESRIGAFEPSLYGTIIYAALTLLAHAHRICNQEKKVIIIVKLNKAVYKQNKKSNKK